MRSSVLAALVVVLLLALVAPALSAAGMTQAPVKASAARSGSNRFLSAVTRRHAARLFAEEASSSTADDVLSSTADESASSTADESSSAADVPSSTADEVFSSSTADEVSFSSTADEVSSTADEVSSSAAEEVSSSAADVAASSSAEESLPSSTAEEVASSTAAEEVLSSSAEESTSSAADETSSSAAEESSSAADESSSAAAEDSSSAAAEDSSSAAAEDSSSAAAEESTSSTAESPAAVDESSSTADESSPVSETSSSTADEIPPSSPEVSSSSAADEAPSTDSSSASDATPSSSAADDSDSSPSSSTASPPPPPPPSSSGMPPPPPSSSGMPPPPPPPPMTSSTGSTNGGVIPSGPPPQPPTQGFPPGKEPTSLPVGVPSDIPAGGGAFSFGRDGYPPYIGAAGAGKLNVSVASAADAAKMESFGVKGLPAGFVFSQDTFQVGEQSVSGLTIDGRDGTQVNVSFPLSDRQVAAFPGRIGVLHFNLSTAQYSRVPAEFLTVVTTAVPKVLVCTFGRVGTYYVVDVDAAPAVRAMVAGAPPAAFLLAANADPSQSPQIVLNSTDKGMVAVRLGSIQAGAGVFSASEKDILGSLVQLGQITALRRSLVSPIYTYTYEGVEFKQAQLTFEMAALNTDDMPTGLVSSSIKKTYSWYRQEHGTSEWKLVASKLSADGKQLIATVTGFSDWSVQLDLSANDSAASGMAQASLALLATLVAAVLAAVAA